MTVRITTDIDLETGAYQVTIKNLSFPGMGIDAVVLQRVWLQVISQLSERLQQGVQFAAMN
jgi:hypothetical protein